MYNLNGYISKLKFKFYIDRLQILDVPPDLDDVVDKAVKMARDYRNCSDILGKMVDDIKKFLLNREVVTYCELYNFIFC